MSFFDLVVIVYIVDAPDWKRSVNGAKSGLARKAPQCASYIFPWYSTYYHSMYYQVLCFHRKEEEEKET